MLFPESLELTVQRLGAAGYWWPFTSACSGESVGWEQSYPCLCGAQLLSALAWLHVCQLWELVVTPEMPSPTKM